MTFLESCRRIGYPADSTFFSHREAKNFQGSLLGCQWRIIFLLYTVKGELMSEVFILDAYYDQLAGEIKQLDSCHQQTQNPRKREAIKQQLAAKALELGMVSVGIFLGRGIKELRKAHGTKNDPPLMELVPKNQFFLSFNPFWAGDPNGPCHFHP
jgi:hypothetical protein